MDRREIDIFEDRCGRDRIGFVFVGPSTALSSEDVRVEFVSGRWRLTLEEPTIVVEHEYLMAALLKLVAQRCGFDADLRWADESPTPPVPQGPSGISPSSRSVFRGGEQPQWAQK